MLMRCVLQWQRHLFRCDGGWLVDVSRWVFRHFFLFFCSVMSFQNGGFWYFLASRAHTHTQHLMLFSIFPFLLRPVYTNTEEGRLYIYDEAKPKRFTCDEEELVKLER